MDGNGAVGASTGSVPSAEEGLKVAEALRLFLPFTSVAIVAADAERVRSAREGRLPASIGHTSQAEVADLACYGTLDRDEFLASALWPAVREALAPSMRAILDGEYDGRSVNVVSIHLDRRFEDVFAMSVEAVSADGRAAEVAAKHANRRVSILRHRFDSSARRNAVLVWVGEDATGGTATTLALKGLLEGRSALSRSLEAIAYTLPIGSASAPTERRR